MRHITCRACGKGYNYDTDGCCPHCGAYNRPPRRASIGSDGAIHIASGDKVCYERKECYEQKECYEGQTRHRGKVSFSSLKHAEEKRPISFATVQSAGKAAYAKGKTAYKKGKQSATIAVVIAVLAALLPNWISSCSSEPVDRSDATSGYDWTDSESGLSYQELEVDQYFYWYGERTNVTGDLYFYDKSEQIVSARVLTDVPPEKAMPNLVVSDGDTQWESWASDAKAVTGGYEYIYAFSEGEKPDFASDPYLTVSLDFPEGKAVTRVSLR